MGEWGACLVGGYAFSVQGAAWGVRVRHCEIVAWSPMGKAGWFFALLLGCMADLVCLN